MRMVSIGSPSPEQMIGYAIPGSTEACDYVTENTWSNNFLQLAKGLQTICRSPESKDKHLQSYLPKSGDARAAPSSPVGHTPPKRSHSDSSAITRRDDSPPLSPAHDMPSLVSPPYKVATPCDIYSSHIMPVRHLQSEIKLAQKLREICHSPREKVLPHDHRGETACGQRICEAHRRPSFLHQPKNLARIDVGTSKADELSLKMDDGQLQIQVRQEEDFKVVGEVEIPAHVDTQHLVCILRDNFLEVSETGKRKATCERHSHSLSETEGVGYWSKLPDGKTPAPIIIEDKVDTDSVRLVLTVPKGYHMKQIRIQTVDDHLIIKGRPLSPRHRAHRSMSVDGNIKYPHKTCTSELIGFTRVFELPSSWDPFSIVAQLNQKHQLIIDAKLTYRCRCHTL